VKRGSGEAVRATSFGGQALEAVLKFWAYSWTCLANLIVGRAPGVEVEG
jgi:transposase, IS4 family